MIICSQCGSTVEDNNQFCMECGTRVRVMPTTPAPTLVLPQPVQTQPQPTAYVGGADGAPAYGVNAPYPSQVAATSAPATASSMTPKLIVGVIAGILVLAVVIALAMRGGIGGDSVEKKLDEAIAKKNLFGASSNNAYALYNELKSSGASEQTLRPYAERLTPLLTETSLKLVKDFQMIGYDESNVSVWQQASKSLNWAAELNPGNSTFASRAAYCDGRIAYLQKQHDQASSAWSKAASLDRSWALPVNGLGMVNLDRGNFSNARTFFADAINREPDWAIPYSNTGSAYYQEENFARAKEFFKRALAKAPNWARPHMQLGNIAVKEGDDATAIAEFESALNPNLIGLKGDDYKNINNALDRARERTRGY